MCSNKFVDKFMRTLSALVYVVDLCEEKLWFAICSIRSGGLLLSSFREYGVSAEKRDQTQFFFKKKNRCRFIY